MSDYPYSWTPSSSIALDDFLKKNKPSMIVDDGTKPWVWVRRIDRKPLDEADASEASEETSKIEQAKQLLSEYTEKIIAIQKDDSIPVRANKKKGLRSKKEVREEIMAEASKEFQRISQESKLTCGKWLFFATPDHVDALFTRLAHDLVEGPLSETSAFCAKVATTPSSAEPNYRHVVCLYLPDLYDKDAVTKVLRVVCQSAGVRPNSAKTDLYTTIGLDSKHPSGIKSTIWNPHDLIPETELKSIIEAYWAEVNKKPVMSSEADDPNQTSDKPAKKTAKVKRKAEDSDDDHVFDEVDGNGSESKGPAADNSKTNIPSNPTTKAPATSEPTAPAPDDSATESESDEPPIASEPSPKDKPSAMVKPAVKPQIDDSSSDEETTKRPKKIRRF
ncbi:hypothetical protein RhiJN_26194 [Ceratobasidium sp. AG-Ba]|nr:hypothetical protein RhiJN_26194 [Ceratobasidium sp. AG-Ba]